LRVDEFGSMVLTLFEPERLILSAQGESPTL
jgi:hypothetical protein